MVDGTFGAGPAAAKGIAGLRIALVALGVLLGLLLIWRGTIVIGAVVLAIASLRAVMIYRLRRFRSERHAAIAARMQRRRGR